MPDRTVRGEPSGVLLHIRCRHLLMLLLMLPHVHTRVVHSRMAPHVHGHADGGSVSRRHGRRLRVCQGNVSVEVMELRWDAHYRAGLNVGRVRSCRGRACDGGGCWCLGSPGRRFRGLTIVPAIGGIVFPSREVTTVRPVLLQVAGDVVAGETLNAHEFEDAGGDSLLHTELLYGLYKSSVKLWGPLHLQAKQK